MSKQVILDRIRAGLGPSLEDAVISYREQHRHYVRQGRLTPQQRLDLMIERLREYDAEVAEATLGTLTTTLASQLSASGRRKLLAPPGLPAEWLVPRVEWIVDRNLSLQEMEEAEGVMTAAFCGVADSGTIILHHCPTEGRRALSLLPDWHLCILRTSQIVETLPEYFARCSEPPRLVTTISGPSATADIEMTRIKGVHGPRYLHVLIVHDRASDTPAFHR